MVIRNWEKFQLKWSLYFVTMECGSIWIKHQVNKCYKIHYDSGGYDIHWLIMQFDAIFFFLHIFCLSSIDDDDDASVCNNALLCVVCFLMSSSSSTYDYDDDDQLSLLIYYYYYYYYYYHLSPSSSSSSSLLLLLVLSLFIYCPSLHWSSSFNQLL